MGLFDQGLFTKKGRQNAKSFLTGTPEEHERVSTFLPEQQSLYNQLQAANQGRGAGGSFGTAGDYYRDLLGNDSQDFNSFAAPQMRQFNEQIIPDLAEQFAGFGGSGSLNGSGFRNAAVNAGTDLSERLGAIRAQLRQQGAQGLMGLGAQGLGNFSQDVTTKQGTEGFLQQAAPIAGQVAGAYFGGPVGASLANQRKRGGVV